MLVLDDLHWFDQASLDFFRFLARQVANQRILLVATYRSDELHRRHPLAPLLPLLVREAGAERVEVQPLGRSGHRALIRVRYALPSAGEERLEQYLGERAEGNPLYAGELLRTLEDEGVLAQKSGTWHLGDLEQVRVPPLLRQVIEGRLARLDEESQRLLGLASVIGQTVSLAIWAQVAEVGDETLLVLAERGEESRLLAATPDGEGIQFSHALIREALYEGIPSLRRRRLHRQIGETLAATSTLPDPDTVAYHFQQAGDSRAYAWLVASGERAEYAYSWSIAAARFESALPYVEDDAAARARLLYRLGFVLRYWDRKKSAQYLAEALRDAEATNDRTLIALCRFEQVAVSGFEDPVPAVRTMQASVDLFDQLSPAEQATVAGHRHPSRRTHLQR